MGLLKQPPPFCFCLRWASPPSKGPGFSPAVPLSGSHTGTHRAHASEVAHSACPEALWTRVGLDAGVCGWASGGAGRGLGHTRWLSPC